MNIAHSIALPRRVFGITVALALCACNQQPVAASGTSPGAPNANGYEVVLETKPEKIAAYVGRVKSFYDLCVASAQAQNLPVKPFVTPPVDYVITRETYLSDGKNFFEKTENFDLDVAAMLPESQCATQIAPNSTTKVWRDGLYQTEQVERGGAPVITPPVKQLMANGARSSRTMPYTQRQTVAGIALRCLPQESAVIQSGAMLASCIFDGANDTTLLNAAGKPITLHARIPSNETDPQFASVSVITPKTVMTGRAIAAGRFALTGAGQ